MDQHPPRVTVNPEVMGGAPCLAGSRLPAQTLIDMVDAGDTWEHIVEGWPWLTPAHVQVARRWLADSRASPFGSFICLGCGRPVFVRGIGPTPPEQQYCPRCDSGAPKKRGGG